MFNVNCCFVIRKKGFIYSMLFEFYFFISLRLVRRTIWLFLDVGGRGGGLEGLQNCIYTTSSSF